MVNMDALRNAMPQAMAGSLGDDKDLGRALGAGLAQRTTCRRLQLWEDERKPEGWVGEPWRESDG